METKRKNRISLRAVWRLCPGRWCVLLLSLGWIGAYFALRSHRGLMNLLSRYAVRPWHRAAGRLFSLIEFSVAEWLILAGVTAALLFLVQLAVHFLRRREGRRLVKWAVTLLMILALVFGFFCLWWGVFYYSDSFSEQTGLTERGVTKEELRAVTEYFAALANESGEHVQRDERGCFTADRDVIFEKSRTLYHNAEAVFPCLAGPELRAKPAVFSRFMSRVNYTGYFFPYTAEANLNVDSPACLIPATIGHELAHQRGVAGEDEANFVGIFASLESGDPDYVYSGALLGYIYLGNALYEADYKAWERVYFSLSDAVRTDLTDNNKYWDQFEDTVASEVSEKVYEGFLRTYGDDRGMKSYGACVDLLVKWYLPET